MKIMLYNLIRVVEVYQVSALNKCAQYSRDLRIAGRQYLRTLDTDTGLNI